MNTDHWSITIIKGVVGVAGGATGAIGQHIDSASGHVAAIFGAVVAILMATNLAFDLRRKWRNRNK